MIVSTGLGYSGSGPGNYDISALSEGMEIREERGHFLPGASQPSGNTKPILLISDSFEHLSIQWHIG